MDSLTQITLGAACGELVLGKKVGNRALLWGAVGGTIPDLDILGNIFLTDVQALAFHRGISHSFTFAIVSPFIFGWLVHRLYQSGLYREKGYKLFVFIAVALFLLGVGFLVNFISFTVAGSINIPVLVIASMLIVYLIHQLWKHYFTSPLSEVNTTYRDWVLLFFWSIFTHPILDAFTAFGTQLFAPFSNYRVAFNTISVVDPIYTVPFLACLIAASFLYRTSRTRRLLTYLGVGLSSAYLLFTVYNKQRIDQIFETAFTEQNIDYQRFRTSPTIFNNILWQGVAETDDTYILGVYSLFDTSKISFYPLEKKHELLKEYESDEAVQILKWFTDDYYTVMAFPDGKFQLSDVRYGSTKERATEPEDFVFRFIITPLPSGLDVQEIRARKNIGESFKALFERIKGK